MNGALDGFLVGLVLFAGFGYASYSLGPKSWRARLLTSGAVLLGRLPAGWLRGLAGRMAATASRAGSCGGCDNCGSSAAAGTRVSAPEVRVPLAKIGKRR